METKTLCCGIDVSHATLDVCYQNNLGELFNLQVGNNMKGFAKIMEQKGSALTSEYPYQAREGSCPETDMPYKLYTWRFVAGDGGTFGDGSEIPSVTDIKSALLTYGPVATGVYASDAFQSYTGGVFNANESPIYSFVCTVLRFN